MKTKIFMCLTVLSILVTACSPLAIIVSSSSEQPAPVEEVETWDSNYQPISIYQIEVEVGTGSPIPVHVIIDADLPDPCSQVEYTEIKQDSSNFIITLFATPDIGDPAVDGCIKDPLPVKMRIPLNMADLPAGSYSVTVNGTHTDFELDTANTTSTLPTEDMSLVKDNILVDSVSLEHSVGSPIPVHAVISANLPNSCAQIGEVRLHQDGLNFFIRLVAYFPAETDCNPDTLPIRVEVPLNVVGLEEGTHTVTVNGTSASFEFPFH